MAGDVLVSKVRPSVMPMRRFRLGFPKSVLDAAGELLIRDTRYGSMIGKLVLIGPEERPAIVATGITTDPNGKSIPVACVYEQHNAQHLAEWMPLRNIGGSAADFARAKE